MKRNILLVALILIGVIIFMKPFVGSSANIQDISTAEAEALYKQPGYVLLDVRTVAEFQERHVVGAVNVPLQEIEQRLNEVPKDITLLVICRSGNRSRQAIEILHKHGYKKMFNVAGGMGAWPK